jgi:hypothetical protein
MRSSPKVRMPSRASLLASWPSVLPARDVRLIRAIAESVLLAKLRAIPGLRSVTVTLDATGTPTDVEVRRSIAGSHPRPEPSRQVENGPKYER